MPKFAESSISELIKEIHSVKCSLRLRFDTKKLVRLYKLIDELYNITQQKEQPCP